MQRHCQHQPSFIFFQRWVSLLFGLLLFPSLLSASDSGSTGSATPSSGLVKIDCRLMAVNGASSTVADANVVVFDDAFSNEVGSEDAMKFPNAGENFAIKRGAKLLVIEGRKPIASADTIPFQLWNLRLQQYRIDVVCQNMPIIVIGFIEDTYLGTSTPINVNGTSSIAFTTTAATMALANRFRLVFPRPQPLACTFTNLKCTAIEGRVSVEWEVVAQRDMASYIVQRSADGRNFNEVSRIAATNSFTWRYSSTDVPPVDGIWYYRIGGISISGEVQWSNIVTCKLVINDRKCLIYPNPMPANNTRFTIDGLPPGNCTLVLYDNTFRRMQLYTLVNTGPRFTVTLGTPALPPGLYWVVITRDNERVEKFSLMVR